MIASEAPDNAPKNTIRTEADAQNFLKNYEQPVFYVSRSATNMVGLENWVQGFRFVTLLDNWNGKHPRVFTPTNFPKTGPRGNINVANWLLKNDQVKDYISKHTPNGFTPQIVVSMFNKETEAICAKNGWELILPKVELRQKLDSKIVTTQIGNEADVPSAPNVLTKITSFADLKNQAAEAGLGERLVLQLPYGDSGRTTYFIENEADFNRVASEIVGPDVKVMRNIPHYPLAAEAVITKSGVVVGPVLREITGHPELAQFKGEWSGSEMYPELLSPEARTRCTDLVKRFSEKLSETGYRGILEVSILLDTETGEAYLGELNPRISGSSSHSNLTAQGKHLPLFAWHILEHSGVTLELDLATINSEREAALIGQTWSTTIVQNTSDSHTIVTSAPKTGFYRVGPEGEDFEFIREGFHWQDLNDSEEVFFLKNMSVGNESSKGLDVGMFVSRIRIQEDHYALTPRAKKIIKNVENAYQGKPQSTLSRYWIGGMRRLRGILAGED